MKKIAITIGGVFVLLFAVLVYNVWRAGMTPVSAAPGPLEVGRQQLHDQLEQSKKREAEIELQDWNSVTLLRGLIKAHQERIDKLTGNSQAAEIVAWDKESISRIESRITDLIAKESQLPAASESGNLERLPNAPSGAEHDGAHPPAVMPRPPVSSAAGNPKPSAASTATTPRATSPKLPSTSPKPPFPAQPSPSNAPPAAPNPDGPAK